MSRATRIFTQSTTPEPTTVNRDGYPAYERSLQEQYLQTLLTNTLGNTFYATQKELIGEAEKLHKEMVKQDPLFMAKALAYARNNGYMRTQPLYGLAVLACDTKGKNIFPFVFDLVVKTPNDLNDFVTMLKAVRGNEGGRKIKRVIGNWLEKHLNEYWVIKYGSDSKTEGYSLSDLLRLTHPRVGKRLPLFDYVLKKENEEITRLHQIQAFEALKTATTEEEKVKCITEGRIPHEVATAFAGTSKTVWNAIVPNLPIFALLRNLATLERHGVLDENKSLIHNKFSDPNIINNSKILPFRFLEAIEHIRSNWAKDSLREALELSFANLPDIEGNTCIFLDISGSMSGQNIQVASIFAVSLMKKTDLNGRFITFDTTARELNISKFDSILTQASRIHSGGGTDTSAPMLRLLRDSYKTDNIILITDEQQNTGSPFAEVVLQYRKSVNPNVKVFVIDIAPYRSAVLPDEKNVYYIYGWSDRVLDYISFVSKGFKSITEFVDKTVLQ